MSSTDTRSSRTFETLRRFAERSARGTKAEERCDLCGASLAAPHDHLIEPANRRISCACAACALLFTARDGARFQRIPREVVRLADFQMSDAQWETWQLPINLAFFYRSSQTGAIVALYPSPAGATESLLSLPEWAEVEAENPVLRTLRPDVEALLVHRVGNVREYFRAPIDECYHLVGLVRTHWHGLSGGSEVWTAIDAFFDRLKRRSESGEENSCAS